MTTHESVIQNTLGRFTFRPSKAIANTKEKEVKKMVKNKGIL
jgi:hypothetical protein